MYDHLLVPVDFSDQCAHALRYAIALAEAMGSTVEALHAWTVPNYILPLVVPKDDDGTASLVDVGNETAGKELESFVDQSVAQRPEGFRTAVEFAPTTNAINAHAKEANALVMGTHTESAIDQLWVGGVTESVLRTVHRPTFLIRNAAHLPKKILVATDLNEASSEALDVAIKLAQLLGASVTVAHVVKRVAASAGLDAFLRAFDANLTGYEDFSVQHAQDKLPKFLGHRAALDLKTIVRNGHPAAELAGLAETDDFDLVVLATKNATRSTHPRVGAVAHKILRTVEVPLLLVPPREPLN